ncbi:MAG: hypothetical protein NTW03_02210 [Verrucomicrobia bacterium]|nr:hypothetical protein [Verrucomicrobiota bacterium]
MKKIAGILIVLALLLVVALVTVAFFLGSIVKKGLETVGPKVAQVEVKLDAANISLFSGHGQLKGFLLGNPPGFDSPSAIKVGDITLEVQPGSVFSDKIVVRTLHVLAPEITLHGLTGDNLKKILDNIQTSSGGASTNRAPSAKKADKAEKKLQVDDLLIQSGKVLVVLPMVGKATVSLPDIHLTDLGKGPAGLTPAELSSKIVDAIYRAAIAAAADVRKGALDVGKPVGKQLDKATQKLGNLFK